MMRIRLKATSKSVKQIWDLFSRKTKISTLWSKRTFLCRRISSEIIQILSLRISFNMLSWCHCNSWWLEDLSQGRQLWLKQLLLSTILSWSVCKRWFKNYFKDPNFSKKILLRLTRMVILKMDCYLFKNMFLVNFKMVKLWTMRICWICSITNWRRS